MGMKWIFYIASAAVGCTGLAGQRKGKAVCLILSALAFPALTFVALWFDMDFADIANGFCIIAFLNLYGLGSKALRNEE